MLARDGLPARLSAMEIVFVSRWCLDNHVATPSFEDYTPEGSTDLVTLRKVSLITQRQE